MNCEKDHNDIKNVLDNLDHYQGREERHKCAGCAYENKRNSDTMKEIVIT